MRDIEEIKKLISNYESKVQENTSKMNNLEKILSDKREDLSNLETECDELESVISDIECENWDYDETLEELKFKLEANNKAQSMYGKCFGAAANTNQFYFPYHYDNDNHELYFIVIAESQYGKDNYDVLHEVEDLDIFENTTVELSLKDCEKVVKQQINLLKKYSLTTRRKNKIKEIDTISKQ